MADHIPFDVQQEIIKKLPVKSLLRCRSVSKSWKSLIDSSEFIAAHTLRNIYPQHRLLVGYSDPKTKRDICLSFVDDHTFPQTKFNPTIPESISRLHRSTLVGNSLGLFCLKTDCKVVVWNPSVRKSVAISVPNELRPLHNNVMGFGVCPKTLDPKIVGFGGFPETMVNLSPYCLLNVVDLPKNVEVYSFRMGKWTSVCSNQQSTNIKVSTFQVVIDRYIYWMAFDLIQFRRGHYNVILSFDMINKSFGVVNLPICLARYNAGTWTICKLRESLAVIESGNEGYDVWMMMRDDGVEMSSFSKMFVIREPGPILSIRTLEFRRSGEPIMEMYSSATLLSSLVVGEPDSVHTNSLGMKGAPSSFFVGSYVETLLLLDRSE